MIEFAIERMRPIVDEIAPLHRAQWDEMPELRPEAAFAPDYERWFRLEAAGSAVLATARRDGVLIGYCQWLINRCMWTGMPYASGDLVYLVPGERGGFIAVRLMQYAHAALESAGVREFRGFARENNRVASLLRYVGYRPTGGRQFVRAVP